jgi:hypothetical protein
VRKIKWIIAGTLLIAFAVFAHLSRAQIEAKNPVVDGWLDQPLPEMELLQDVTTEEAFAKLLFRAKISGGIAGVESCLVSPTYPSLKHSYALAGLTMRQALNLIVADDTRYRWTTQNRVVNLVSVHGIPDVLRTRLAHFEIKADESVGGVGATLFDTNEVKQAISSHKLTRENTLSLIIGGAPVKLERSQIFGAAKVMDILNAAARLNRYPAVWQYTERVGQCKNTYYFGWPVGTSVKDMREAQH